MRIKPFWRACVMVGILAGPGACRPSGPPAGPVAANRWATVKLDPGPRPAQLVRARALPDPAVTPGAIYAGVGLAQIRAAGWSATVRDVPESVKREIFRRDQIDPAAVQPGQYEIDHLVPLCLGGSNDPANLWAQSYRAQPYNAHLKDRLETWELAAVRAGKIDLATAQRELAGNWIDAYQRHLGPVPARTDPPAQLHRED